jgi:hypothetical protein
VIFRPAHISLCLKKLPMRAATLQFALSSPFVVTCSPQRSPTCAPRERVPRVPKFDHLEGGAAALKVIQTVREKFTCRSCEKITQLQ